MTPELIAERLAQFDTCVLADAVDRLGLRLNNRGFARSGLHSVSGTEGSVAGYAATARIRSSNPSVMGRTYFHHTEWWAEMNRLPMPRIVVIEDVDHNPGTGACIGQMAAAAFRALHCIGAVTNGSARDIPALTASGFHVLAAHVSPSRAYAHIVEHSCEVEIFGLRIKPGDLLVADRHGVLSIPVEHAGAVCIEARSLAGRKQAFVGFCSSDRFSIERMEEELRLLES